MNVSNQDRIYLYGQALAALIPLKIKTTPPTKDGSTKTSTVQFAAACWAKRYLDAAVYVLERDTPANQPELQGSTTERDPF